MHTTDLLGRPYLPPPLRKGDHSFCLYRNCDVVVTSWNDARISWPRCRALAHRGGSGLLVTEELVRAVRTESVEAIKFWFGVGSHAVWNWRRAFGVGQWATEGSRRLHQELSEAGAAMIKGKKQPQSVIRRRMQTRKERRAPPPVRWKDSGWTAAQLALLGTLPDKVLAARIGRSPNAVRIKRTREGIPTIHDRRRKQ